MENKLFYNMSKGKIFKLLKESNDDINPNKLLKDANKNNSKEFIDINEMYKYIDKYCPKFRENFELTNYISSGGTGIVYEGKLKRGSNRQKLAFKFKIKPKKKNDKESQEISILKKLKHKNIIEIYAFIRMNDNQSHFSVIELGKNGDLEYFQKVLLKRKILSETFACYLAKQILDALEYIHRCKVIHMDIKQGNILVDSNLNIKLTDFSVSCSYNSFHPEDFVKFPFAGTSKYMCPEIINRTHMKIKESCKIDLYSLGVTLYDIVYGIYPYKLNDVGSKDYENILKNIKEEKLEFPPDRKVSQIFKDFVRGLLEKDYTKRFNIEKALNHPWIKGADILFEEKEKAFCHENFLINLITDNIPKFNQYNKNF
jgi:polo-like kinase 1